ncbi:MAG: hypothetical protein IT289_05185, partial [Oligoflexia bacterium]|nr:hypothetical protein [Oligoflexia bacterium]
MKSLFVVVVVAVVCLWPMVGITSDWKQYPYYPKQANLSFPKDEGAHKAKLLEWWYVVIHAKGETTGDEYSILVTHFSNRFRFFDVTNISANVHLSGTTNGRIKAAEGYLDVRQQTPWGTDIMRTKRTQAGGLIPFEYEMLTHHSSMGLQAELVAQKPPMMVGGDAYVQIGKSGWSWYYSLSRLEVRGRLTFNGITENISGIGWMDHQWGPFLISPVELGGVFESYEWFCVQLDDGTEMMISNIYDRKYRLPQTAAYGGVGIYYKDGSMDGVVKKTFVRTKYWFDPDSKTYMSMGWRLIIPEMDTDLILTPKIENQMVSFPLGGSFWEGAMRVEGKLRGKPVNGVGFGELMHHFQGPKLQLS